MGFIIAYNRFFKVTFSEESGLSTLKEFRFFVTKKTQRLFNNYKLVFRPESHGFEVYYRSSPLIPISEKICFTFGFSISAGRFFENYGLVNSGEGNTEVCQPGLCFNNLKEDGAIIKTSPSSIVADGSGLNERVSAADTCKIHRQTFKVFNSAKETVPDNYKLKHKYDSSIQQTVPVVRNAGIETITTTINPVEAGENYIDRPGPYLLESGTEPPVTQSVYLNNELGQKSVRGVIDIYWDASQNSVADPQKGQEYKITFKPK